MSLGLMIGATLLASAASTYSSYRAAKKANKQQVAPTPQIPAAPAPVRRSDTGAKVVIGSDAVKNQRVSGSRKKQTSRKRSVLSGLGKGGINL